MEAPVWADDIQALCHVVNSLLIVIICLFCHCSDFSSLFLRCLSRRLWYERFFSAILKLKYIRLPVPVVSMKVEKHLLYKLQHLLTFMYRSSILHKMCSISTPNNV